MPRSTNRYSVPIEGMTTVVIGRATSDCQLLSCLNVVLPRTRNPEEMTRQADIIIYVVLVSSQNMVRGSWIKLGASIIIVGNKKVEGFAIRDFLGGKFRETFMQKFPGD